MKAIIVAALLLMLTTLPATAEETSTLTIAVNSQQPAFVTIKARCCWWAGWVNANDDRTFWNMPQETHLEITVCNEFYCVTGDVHLTTDDEVTYELPGGRQLLPIVNR